jgi:hypothetical protein
VKLMAETTGRTAALQDFVDHRAQPEEKRIRYPNAYGKTHQ